MNFSREMLEAATRSRPYLGDAANEVEAFVRRRMAPDGGFRGRDGAADLYYTVFGVDCLLAVGAELPAEDLKGYLLTFGDGHGLDLIHLSCLARCWSRLPGGAPGDLRDAAHGRVQSHRAQTGGYGLEPGSSRPSIYGCFLAQSACDDFGIESPDAEGILRCVEGLGTGNGSYANERGAPASTNAVVGAVLLSLRGGRRIDPASPRWLVSQHRPEGGFLAAPGMPVPDLVSTATAVFALRAADAVADGIRQPCRDFVAGLWDPQGGFCGHWLDDRADCEHTFHGLLTIGCLEERP
jgi:prenyltransferase beta subunit